MTKRTSLHRLPGHLSGLAIASMGLLACGSAPADATGTSSEPVISGTPVTNETLGSALLYYCPSGSASCYASPSAAAWLCSGTMVADRWLLTAHHCLTTSGEATTGGTAVVPGNVVVFQPNGQSSATGVQVFLHPTLDVALVELSGSVLSPAGTVETTPIYPSSETGFTGRTLYCEGYGINVATPTSGQGTLRSALLTVSQASVGSLTLEPNNAGQSLASGDSGAGCFLNAPGVSPNYVVSVHSTENVLAPGLDPLSDNEVGADGFESWAAGIVAANACSIAGAACGTVTDGFGAAVSCGTCGTGDVCSENRCVCAPKKCPSSMTWNSATCSCQISCHSAITCCAAAGGTWEGGHCI